MAIPGKPKPNSHSVYQADPNILTVNSKRQRNPLTFRVGLS
jgi:hypothetical protein